MHGQTHATVHNGFLLPIDVGKILNLISKLKFLIGIVELYLGNVQVVEDGRTWTGEWV